MEEHIVVTMSMDLAALVNSGVVKAHKKDPEIVLTDFNLYMKSFSDFLIVMDNKQATAAKKKLMLRAVSGSDMVFLFDYIGKVPTKATFDVAIQTIHAAITGQTNKEKLERK